MSRPRSRSWQQWGKLLIRDKNLEDIPKHFKTFNSEGALVYVGKGVSRVMA